MVRLLISRQEEWKSAQPHGQCVGSLAFSILILKTQETIFISLNEFMAKYFHAKRIKIKTVKLA